MTIRLVKKFQQENQTPAVEEVRPASCKEIAQSWVDEFKKSRKTGSPLAAWSRLGAPQSRPSSDYSHAAPT